jgi:NAD(P)-dependent dehydrogenase (short-subunit alcohol dehydrogenase family)
MTGPFDHLTEIRGQVAVVTGGTVGIGGACTARFAREGATVIAIGRDPAKGAVLAERLRRDGGDAHFIACDCADEDQVAAATATILERWGRADILCNIAGGWIEAPPIEDVTKDALHHSFDWNLTSKFLITRDLVPAMKANDYGRIVMMSSSTGRRGRLAAALQYSTMEAGVIGLTRALALQLAPHGITVNAIAPGTTLTPRAERHSAERLAATARAIPVQRLGTVDEQAHAIWYLCTPGAAFTTGAVLDVNGGNWTG